jgi:hypothetical protein
MQKSFSRHAAACPGSGDCYDFNKQLAVEGYKIRIGFASIPANGLVDRALSWSALFA